mgnify:CR=1 FL=1
MLRLVQRPSPNFNERVGAGVPDILLMHYTGMQSCEAAVTRLTDPAARVSSHYTVDEDGTVYVHVDEALRAWHAGVSSWAGEEDINSCSIGIEMVNRGHDWGYPDFPLRQIAAVIALCRGIVARREIPRDRVLAHIDDAVTKGATVLVGARARPDLGPYVVEPTILVIMGGVIVTILLSVYLPMFRLMSAIKS